MSARVDMSIEDFYIWFPPLAVGTTKRAVDQEGNTVEVTVGKVWDQPALLSLGCPHCEKIGAHRYSSNPGPFYWYCPFCGYSMLERHL